jgi:hypothetical protein
MKLLEFGEVGADENVLEAGEVPLAVNLLREGVRQVELLQVFEIGENPSQENIFSEEKCLIRVPSLV